MLKIIRTFGWQTMFLLLLAQVLACTAPVESDGSSQTNEDPIILRRGNYGDPQSLDPALAEDVHAFNVLADLYEGLVVETADGALQPGVADRWDLSPDGRQYTFYLRDDAVWSNGDPVTADEFFAAFQRAISPGTVSPYSFLLEPILNYHAVTRAELPAEDLGVRALDERTLVIELQDPAPYFAGILAMPIAYPLHSGQNGNPGRFSDPETFVGNGPFVLESWLPGGKIRLRKNVLFRNASSVGIDIVDYYPITEPTTEYNMFRAGELDITATVPPSAISSLRDMQSHELRIAPTLGLYYLAFDLTEPPFDDVVLRQALTTAIDREVLVSVLGRGEQGAFGIVPPGVANYRGAEFGWKDLTTSARQALARDLFADAGYGDSRPLSMKLTYDAGAIHETVALTVASMWRDVLGVDVELEKMEWKLFLATRDNRPAWQVMRFAWTGDYNDASTFADIFDSTSPQNLPRYQNPAYDSLLQEASKILDREARARKLREAEALLINDYPIAPLYYYVSKHLVSDRVQNFESNVLDRHPSRHLQIADER